jgi:hypothetical protein
LEILSGFIDVESQKIDYRESETAPSTYKAMRETRDRLGYFVIYNGASLTSIFSPEINVKFRAVHDSFHYFFELGFTFNEEKHLSELQALDFYFTALRAGYSELIADSIYKIVNAEIRGQIEYYEKNKKFIKNQREYILNYLNVA